MTRLWRTALVLLGSIMTMAGLAMTAMIVMLPMGVILGLAGLAIILCGACAPASSSGG